jgi:hypothetical protein
MAKRGPQATAADEDNLPSDCSAQVNQNAPKAFT